MSLASAIDRARDSSELQGKRVAMVLFSYYPSDPRPRRAAEALVGAGMEVDLICLRESATDSVSTVVKGVNVRRVPMARRRGGILGYLYQYLAFFLISSAIIIRRSFTHRYAMVYVHNMPDFLVFAGTVPKLMGAKVVLDLHDPMPELMQTIFDLPATARSVSVLKFIERWSLRFADSVITVNRACAKLFASRGCPSSKISVVMNSPDEEIFRPKPSSVKSPLNGSKPFVVMYHGSLVERNGLGLAIEAFARLRSSVPSAELRIYGTQNSFLERVMQSVRSQGLEDCVRYLGPKPLEQIVEAIGQCDVGVIPNQRSIFTELNTPTRIFEYLALGKPVIAPNAPGITDYFDGESLIYFDLGNAEDLAQKLEYTFRNPEKVRETARRGQEIHLRHTWRAERGTLLNLVSSLLGSAPVQSPATMGAGSRNQPGS
ncbi:MAG TPA: glycosyltransferase family 4 protein [Terriglobia bacterium]|nr:glycosyltransferase family 4 protein [Terriglobia bacterium]